MQPLPPSHPSSQAIRPSTAPAARARLCYFSWSRRTTRTSRASGRIASRRPTDGGEASPTPQSLATSIVRRRNVASPGFVVTPAAPSGCSCPPVAKGASVPHVTPRERPLSPRFSATKCSKTFRTRCGFSPSPKCSECTSSITASFSASSPVVPTRRYESS